ARNLNGQVIFYGDRITDSMSRALEETRRRREIQGEYNRRMGITPQTIRKAIPEGLIKICESDYVSVPLVGEGDEAYLSVTEFENKIDDVEQEMLEAARNLEFERAAELRDQLLELKDRQIGIKGEAVKP
ncbi:MAG: UvrB/UvrC motif-containing protein, partial [bacterium]|nr:UvrB/UvrC motif-containing protein [bacterium]